MMYPPHRTGRIFGFAVLVALAIMSGCQPSSPSPLKSPKRWDTKVGGSTLSLIRWPDGPTVMICTDIDGGNSYGGARSAGPPWIEEIEGSLTSRDGRKVVWRMETTDGRSFKCQVNAKDYDLAKGTLFLVKTKGGATEVEQLSRDLSAVQLEAESCKNFAENDPAVSKLLGKDE
jgi:hypothetical protein